MGMLSMKFNSDEMFDLLQSSLRPGETLTAAVYGSFYQTGFFASNRNVEAGYIGLSDCGRLFGIRCSFLSTENFSYEIAFLKKIKIKKALFGARNINIDGPEGEMRFAVVPKITGRKFPDQPENFQRILEALEAKQATL